MSIVNTTEKDIKILSTIIREANKDVAQLFGLTIENNAKHPSFCKEDWVLKDFERGEEYLFIKKMG